MAGYNEILKNVGADKLCRTCFQQSTRLHPLFIKTEQFPEKSLADILLDIAKIDINLTLENMPTHLCGTCSRKLKNAYNFVLKAQDTHKRLLSYIEPNMIRQPDCLLEAPIDIPSSNAADFLQIKMETDEFYDGVTFLMNNSGNSSQAHNTSINKEAEQPSNQAKKLKRNSDDEELPLASIKTTIKNTRSSLKKSCESESKSLSVATKQEPGTSTNSGNLNNLENGDAPLDPITVTINRTEKNTDDEDLCGLQGSDYDVNISTSDSDDEYSKKLVKRKKIKRKKVPKGTKSSSTNRIKCNICDQTFAWSKDLKRHQLGHNRESNEVPCLYCDKKFIRKDKLKNHINKVHFPKRVHPEWDFAEKLFTSEAFKIIECKLCLKKFSNTQELRNHIPQHSDRISINVGNNEIVKELYPSSQLEDTINLICDDIQKNQFAKFYSIVNSYGYEMCLSDSDNDGANNEYTCEICSEKFNRKYKVFNHIKEKHISEVLPHKCHVCRMGFVCKKMLEVHLRTQCKSKAKKFKCVKCPGKFMWVENLNNHDCSYRKSKEEIKKHNLKLEKSDKDKSSNESVLLHLSKSSRKSQIHAITNSKRKKKMDCKLCGNEFEKLSDLRQHVYSHIDGITGVNLKKSQFIDTFYPNAEVSGIPQMICADFAAGNISKFYSALDESGNELHMSDSETENESETNAQRHVYRCELCNKEFNRRKSILSHQDLEHTGVELPHGCSMCEKKFVCSELLQHHLKTNCRNADKKWPCPKCTSKFMWETNLHNHLNLKHSDFKTRKRDNMGSKLQCDECDKTFIWPKDLSRHKRCHLPDDEKFLCPLCDRRFTRKDNMQSHMKTHGNSNVVSGGKIITKNKLKVVEIDERLCNPNGCKIIQCKICLSKHMKISDLKAHLKGHKDNIDFSNREEGVAEMSMIFYPDENVMNASTLIDRIKKDITEHRYDKFYSITNEFGYEMDLNSSETESDSDAEENTTHNTYKCDLCNKTFDRKYKVYEHQSYAHTWTDASHVCGVCQARFVSSELYNIHLKAQCQNVDKRFVCRRCPWRFMWRENLKNHVRSVHGGEEEIKKKPEPERKFVCQECGKTFVWQKDLTRHMIIHTPGGGLYKCTLCPRKFYRKDNLHVHLKRHGLTPESLAAAESYISSTSGPNSPKIINCKSCNQFFDAVSLLRDHLAQYPYGSCRTIIPSRNESTTPQFKTELLPYNNIVTYSITNSLGYELDLDDSETDNEIDPKKYVCEICHSEFGRKYEIAQHQRNSHGYDEMPKKCLKCNFKTANEIILQHHQKTQCLNEQKQFNCDICSFKFMWSENLEKHKQIIHANEPGGGGSKATKRENDKTFECLMCNRKYNRKDRLMAHIKKKHEKPEDNNGVNNVSTLEKKVPLKKFLCAFCGKAVTSSSNLIIHMRRHTGEKPFKCEYCDKGFPRSSDLACHRRTHTGEKPHKCTVCEKAFSRSYKLQTHMRIHSGERPYKCTYCEKSFAQSNDCTLHVRRHTGERPYVCGICGERFIQGTALKNHRTMRGHYEDVDTNLSTLLLVRS